MDNEIVLIMVKSNEILGTIQVEKMPLSQALNLIDYQKNTKSNTSKHNWYEYLGRFLNWQTKVLNNCIAVNV